jgi:hypothetical protein
METIVLLSVTGCVAAVFVPAFVRNLEASRLAEPLEGLRAIGARATLLANERGADQAYPPSVGLTPAEIPAGQSVVDPEGTWDDPTWQLLGFEQLRPHYFAFAFDSNTSKTGSSFTARAHGDLDGDGLSSTFKLSGEFAAGDEAVLYPLEMDREVE